MQNTAPESRTPGNKLLSKLAASRFLTTSLIIHLVLISVLGSVVLFKAAQVQTAFVVSENEGFLQEAEDIAEIEDEQPQAEFAEDTSMPAEAAPAPSVQSTISSLTDSQASWSTPASFEHMSVGTTLGTAMPAFSGAPGPSMPKAKMGPLGKSSSFTFMGIKSESRRVAFLLDASGSMILDSKGGGKAYEDLKAKLVNLVEQLNPETEFNVIMFGVGAADAFQPKAVPATGEYASELKKWLEPYMRDKAGLLRQSYSKTRLSGAWGTTRLDIALEAAFEMQAETIFVLTDGTPSVTRAASAETLKKWEENKIKNKASFEKFKKETAEYETKFKAEIEQAKKKAAQLNAAVSGRTQEVYHWESFAPPRPQAPPGYYRPHERVTADDFNKMMKEMFQEYYVPNRMAMPALNVIGYHVSEGSEEYLKEMTKGIPGKFKTFKK